MTTSYYTGPAVLSDAQGAETAVHVALQTYVGDVREKPRGAAGFMKIYGWRGTIELPASGPRPVTFLGARLRIRIGDTESIAIDTAEAESPGTIEILGTGHGPWPEAIIRQ